MKPRIQLAASAVADMIGIWSYVARHDSLLAADRLRTALEQTARRLEGFPSIGHVVPELERAGVRDYREIHHKPYLVKEDAIHVVAILDGRRDLRELLVNRALGIR